MTQLSRFQAALAKTDIEAALLSSSLSQRYLSDFHYSDGYILVTPDTALLLADFRYIEAAKKEVKNFEVMEPKDGMLVELSKQISERKLHRVAIEEDALSCAALEKLREIFPKNIELVSGVSRLLCQQRAIKLPYELERIATAQEITDRAFSHILRVLADRPSSMTEQDVALELEYCMRKNGAEDLAFHTIAVSGPSSSLPHGVPQAIPLREGFLTMDFGAKAMGYCSDMTRTVVLGHATAEMRKVYDTVLSAQLNALNGIREGIKCRDADALARDPITKAGYGDAFGHSLGHGVGLYIHEDPRLSSKASEDSVLRAGHVVTVEPGIYLCGKFGCRIEDMVTICEDGSLRNFTKSPKELIEL